MSTFIRNHILEKSGFFDLLLHISTQIRIFFLLNAQNPADWYTKITCQMLRRYAHAWFTAFAPSATAVII